MRINYISDEIFRKAKKACKKPIAVKIEGPVTAETVVSSWENTAQIAHPGDYIVTGIKGEQYPIPEAVFKDYERDPEAGEHMYKKAMKIIYAHKVDFQGEVETSQGDILEFQPGYYIVMESPENMWAVEGQVFDESYDFVDR
jgi:hypothetical protein